MTHPELDASLADGGRAVRLSGPQGRGLDLHPHWLRERTREPEDFDPDARQRLFEPSELAKGLRVTGLERLDGGRVELAFSDGHRCRLSLVDVAREAGWLADPQEPPAPRPWRADGTERPEARWGDLDAPGRLLELLAGFHRAGFCIVRETPTKPGTLKALAQRFGYVRDTHFGPIFDVVTEPRPIDLAYTGLALSAHTDNPYRRPVPGIQLLHCLVNEVAGGLSTLVDGLALAEALAAEAPQLARVLEETEVRFRYESDSTILVDRAPLIARGPDGQVRHVRFSTRVDYVPPMEPARLEHYYRARRRLAELAADARFRLGFRLEPGMLLIMDNHRLLHGRTGFDHGAGRRHLQGCYIDHDGPDGLYRVLVRDHGLAGPALSAA